METNPKSRKRKFLKIEDKVDVIKQIENGRRKCEVGKQYGLVSSTVHSIWKNRANILQSFEQRGFKVKVEKPIKLSKPDQRDIDEALLEWFYLQRSKNFLVSGPTLRAKAEEFARNMDIDNFICTKSWLDRFKVRHNISLYGKVNSEGERSSGESSQYNADDDGADELEEHNGVTIDESECVPGTISNEQEDRVDEPELEEEGTDEEEELMVTQQEPSVLTYGNANGIDSSSETDEDSIDAARLVCPTLDHALAAMRTIKRFYSSSDNAQLVGAIKIIDEDLDLKFWNHLRPLIRQLHKEANSDCNHTSDTGNH